MQFMGFLLDEENRNERLATSCNHAALNFAEFGFAELQVSQCSHPQVAVTDLYPGTQRSAGGFLGQV